MADRSHIKRGKVKIGEQEFNARSGWEANIGAYLEFLRNAKEISKWEHEPDEFWFPIKRGNRSYLPDFKVTRPDGSIYYIEVKGYMDAASKTKLNRMAKYHPEIEIQLIEKDRYKSIARASAAIPQWGLLQKQNENKKPTKGKRATTKRTRKSPTKRTPKRRMTATAEELKGAVTVPVETNITKEEHALMTVNEVAKYLKMPIPTIYHLLHANELPGAVKIGGRWRVKRQELKAKYGLTH